MGFLLLYSGSLGFILLLPFGVFLKGLESVRMKDRRDWLEICPASLPESHHTGPPVYLAVLVFVLQAVRRRQSQRLANA